MPNAISERTEAVEAARLLTRCRRLLVIAGAGCSADAGVPTFRGEGGYWREWSAETLASPTGFERDRELVWAWYRERRLHVASCQPHPGQRSIALLQRHFPAPGQVLVATTNEDDLLDRAGVAEVVHLHGSLYDTACAAGCGWRGRDEADNALSLVPCPGCGAPTRPGSVWFGEPLAGGTLERIAAFDPDGCVFVGSSALIQPVAGIPSELVLNGHPVIEINPEETPVSSVATLSIRRRAAEALPPIVDLLTSITMRDQLRRLS